jgi:hypothetical protein
MHLYEDPCSQPWYVASDFVSQKYQPEVWYPRSMRLMDQAELALWLPADFVLATSQRWKELAMSEVSWKRMNHSSLLLEIAVALEVALWCRW